MDGKFDWRSLSCKRCKAVNWIDAVPLGTRNYDVFICGNCLKKNHVFTRKWGKLIQW